MGWGNLQQSAGDYHSTRLVAWVGLRFYALVVGYSQFSSWLLFVILAYNKLNGPLPWELSKLRLLDFLDLESNQLEGPIPTELGLLSMHQLTLKRNNLSGPMPLALFGSTIVYLDLASNQLTGTIPTEVGLYQWQVISLGHNMFSGALPTEIFKATSLHFLSVEHNHRVSPRATATCFLCHPMDVQLLSSTNPRPT